MGPGEIRLGKLLMSEVRRRSNDGMLIDAPHWSGSPIWSPYSPSHPTHTGWRMCPPLVIVDVVPVFPCGSQPKTQPWSMSLFFPVLGFDKAVLLDPSGGMMREFFDDLLAEDTAAFKRRSSSWRGLDLLEKHCRC